MAAPIGSLVRGLCFAAFIAIGCGDAHPNGSSNGTPGNGGTDAGANAFPEVVIPEVAEERIGDNVFDENQVQSYYLTLTSAEYAKLTDLSTLLNTPWEVNQDRYVRASLRVGDTELPSIAIRYKGNYSIWGCVDFGTKQRVKRVEPFYGNIDVCQRFSLKLDFDRYVDRFRLDGLKKLNLHAMAADASKLHERLGYSLFRDMGITAPRAVHARLYINGEYQGLVAAVEEVDGRFTANRFGVAGDGNLYRDLWPSTVDASTSAAKNALRTNDDPGIADVADFSAFRDVVASATEANFESELASFVDFDYLARYIVVDRGINNFDGIMSFYYDSGWGPNNQNYFWYDVGAGRFTLIPWDLDKTFLYPDPYFWTDNAPNGKSVIPNWNVVTSSCQGYETDFDSVTTNNGVRIDGTYHVREIDCDPFLKLLRGVIYDRQQAIADAFITGPFSEAQVKAKLENWRTQVATAISEDPSMNGAQWKTAVDDLEATLPTLQSNLQLVMSGLIHE